MTTETEAPVPLTEEQEKAAWDQAVKDRQTPTRAEDAPVTTEAAPDPLASLPEPTRKLIEGLGAKLQEQDKRIATFDRQLGTANGTIGNLKQRLDESQGRLKEITPTIEAVEAEKKAAAEAKSADLAKRRGEVRERLADFPDIVEYLDMVVPADATPAAVVKPEPKAETKVEPEVVNDGYDAVTVARLQLDLADRVPGWRTKKDTPDFKAWAGAQSADLQEKLNSWDVDEVVGVFEAFEKHKSDAAEVARVEKERQERLLRGEGPKGRGSSTGAVDTSDNSLWNQAKRDREKARQGA